MARGRPARFLHSGAGRHLFEHSVMFDVIPVNGQTWLICGGRNFTDQAMFDSAMGDLVRLKGMPVRVVHGGARGADTIAGKWALDHAALISIYRADWAKHGRGAGPIRNQEMLDKQSPDLVIAFPGGKGTADMVARARKRGVDVAEIVPAPAATYSRVR